MIKEIISPNVKLILPDHTPLGANTRSIRIYDNDVYVLDLTGKNSYKRWFSTLFNDYELNGAVYDVGTTGIPTDDNSVGSRRFCAWNPNLAFSLEEVIKENRILELIENHGGAERWKSYLKFAGVSKYFRFMRYRSGGEHFPHYDSDFEVGLGPDSYYTKYSMILYCSDTNSGDLAFVNDPRSKEQINDQGDWERQATEEEIILKVRPREGRLVLFPHTLCHTVLPYTDEEGTRDIIRGDLIFNRLTSTL